MVWEANGNGANTKKLSFWCPVMIGTKNLHNVRKKGFRAKKDPFKLTHQYLGIAQIAIAPPAPHSGRWGEVNSFGQPDRFSQVS